MVEYSSNVTVGQYCSKILWQNVAALRQDRTVAEICIEHINVKTEQYHEQNAIAKYHCNTIEFYNKNTLRTLQ